MSEFLIAPWTSPASVQSMLVTPPVEEPLTLEEAKLRAGVDWASGDPREALMLDWIRTARAQVEQDTALALLTQTRDIVYDAYVPEPFPLPMQATPLQSLDVAVVSRTRGRRPIRAWVSRRGGWPVLHTAPREGEVEYLVATIVSGWTTAAVLRVEAPLLVQAVGLLTAHYATLGRDLATVEASGGKAALVPMGYEELIAPHRLMWLT